MKTENSCKRLSRGFVTVATGSYYYWLAENLVMSYRLFSRGNIPFYLITDKAGEKRFSKGWRKELFDGLIVLDKPYYSYMDKMMVYQNTVFYETIFLDADVHIVDDIDYLFDVYEKNGSEVSVNGWYKFINEENRPNHFNQTTMDLFGFDKYIAFGGGLYYYQKGEKADKVLKYIFDELLPNYDKYGLTRFLGRIADEPLFAVSMLLYGMKPVWDSKRSFMQCPTRINGFTWDFDEKKCSFFWHGEIASPRSVHYGTHNTYTRYYVRYNSLLRCKYRSVPKFLHQIYKASSFIQLGCRMLKKGEYRRGFMIWFKGHFTKDYWRTLGGRIKNG